MIGLRDDIDIICFYTGTKYNKAIPELPMRVDISISINMK